MEKNSLEALDFANILIDSISDKKGRDILLLDMREQSILSDYFLLCSASNDRQLKAIAEAVKEEAKEKAGISSTGYEGTPQSGWMLIDFGDLVIHVFSEEQRAYYNLEELWQKSHIVMRMP